MKKSLALLLAILTVLSFAACNNDSTPNNGSTSSQDSSETAGESGSTQKTTDDENQYTLADATIVDNEYCAFTITSVDPDNTWGFTVKALCENKSEMDLMFSWGDVSVNGYMIDPFWASEVAAGKKSNVEISFTNSNLQQCGISTVEEITFILSIYNSDDWMADKIVSSEYTAYPTGLTSDTISYQERASAVSDQIIVDNGYCTFIITSVEPDNIWGYTLNCYLVNKTDKSIMFSWNDVSVNGFMIDPYWAKEVAAGKRAYADVSFSTSGFTDNGIETVEDIEFKLRVYDSGNWTAEDMYNEIITYNP